MAVVAITLGGVMNGGQGETRIEVNGQDITKMVRSFTLNASAHDVTTLELDCLCLDGVVVEGVAQVLHNCGLEI